MKFGKLESIAHNVADSLGSGIGLLVGVYEMDIFGEAKRSPEGYITVDFLTGTSSGGIPSADLARAIALYKKGLAELCEKHGTTPAAFQELTARFSGDRYIVVSVTDHTGRRSSKEFVGTPARRLVTGANGSGKSNLYRALRLLSEAAQGGIVASLAKEGGLASALWAGPEQISRRMKSGEIPIQGGPRTQAVALRLGFMTEAIGDLCQQQSYRTGRCGTCCGLRRS